MRKEKQTICGETKTVRISGVLLSVLFALLMRNERLVGPEPHNSLAAEARTGGRFPLARTYHSLVCIFSPYLFLAEWIDILTLRLLYKILNTQENTQEK